MKPKVTGVPETFLIPLWARAVETTRTNGIISDYKAVEIMNSIEYDFAKFKKAQKSQIGIAIRTLLFDNAVKDFIKKNPKATIVNFGAGLDARFLRVDNGEIEWYDLDLPESIIVRSNFFTESNRSKMIAKSIFDYTWIDDINATVEPILFVAEGLFMYFDEKQIKALFEKISKNFMNSEMLFETIGIFASNHTKLHDSVGGTGAVFRWGVDSPKGIISLCKNLSILNEWSLLKNIQRGQKCIALRIIGLIPIAERKISNRIFHVLFNS